MQNPMEFHLVTERLTITQTFIVKRSDYADLNLKCLIKLNQHIKEIVSWKDETTTERAQQA
jgi:hypothetical protein